MEIISDHKDFKFVKELVSDTKVRAVHFKLGKQSYHVAVSPMPRMGWFVSGYVANRSGRPENIMKYLFKDLAVSSNNINKATDEDLQIGVTKLIQCVTNNIVNLEINQ